MGIETIGNSPAKQEGYRSVFTIQEKQFLTTKLDEMKGDTLLEDEYVFRVDEKYGELGVYPQEDVDEDKKWVVDFEKSMRRQNEKQEMRLNPEQLAGYREGVQLGKYFETLFYFYSNKKDGWFPGAQIYKASKFDDYYNKIDFIAEFGEDHLGIATDLVMANDPVRLQNKLRGTFAEVVQGKLSQVKYFQTKKELGTFSVPRIVLAVDSTEAIKLMQYWASGDTAFALNHPVKIKLWLEAKLQLEGYMKYLEAWGSKYDAVTKNYRLGIAYLEKVLEENKKSVDLYGALIKESQSYRMIEDHIKIDVQREIDRIPALKEDALNFRIENQS